MSISLRTISLQIPGYLTYITLRRYKTPRTYNEGFDSDPSGSCLVYKTLILKKITMGSYIYSQVP